MWYLFGIVLGDERNIMREDTMEHSREEERSRVLVADEWSVS